MPDTMSMPRQFTGVAQPSHPLGGTVPRSSDPETSRHAEGPVAAAIEEYTAQLPSDVYLWAAGVSILGSLGLKASGRDHAALFVGQWVAPFLVLGLYNMLVKVAGTDRAGTNR